jgi:tripartite-type tricarboxylate transporter receptor subunit TctC
MMRLAFLLFSAVLAFSCFGQGYPSKAVRVIVPYPPGGTTDVFARRLAEGLRARFGQPFVVENRPGAATQVGVQELLRAPADGHTLIMATTSTMSLNPVVFAKLSYSVAQLAPEALMFKVPFTMDAALNFPPSSIGEVVAYARANPGKVNVGTTGQGTSGHLIMEMFKAAAGVDIVPVHYKGGAPAIQDILGGHIQLYFDGATSSLAHYANKRLKILGVTSDRRVPALGDVPTFAEAGLPGVQAYFWSGLAARAETPPAIVERLNQASNAFMATPAVQEQLTRDAAIAGALSPEQFARMIAEETETFRRIVVPLNLKLD